MGTGVVGAVTALQAVWLRPPFLYDPTDYLMTASRIGVAGAHHRSLRIGVIFPMWGALETIGYSQLSFYLVSFLAVGLTAWGTYWLGTMLFGRWVGAVAGVIAVFNPVIMIWSSQPYPDLLATGLFTLGVAVLVHVARRPTSDDRTGLALGLLAGALFGWAYLARELIVFVFPVALVIVLSWRLRWRILAVVALGVLLMVGVEWLWGAIRYDDPLIRLRVLVESQQDQPGDAIAAGVEAMRNQPLLRRVGTFVVILWEQGGGLLWIVLLALATAGALLVRSRGFLVLTSWFLIWYAFLTAANYLEVLRASDLIRYWYPVFPPLALGSVAGLAAIGSRLARRRRWKAILSSLASTAILLLVAVATWSQLSANPAFTRNGATQYEEFRDWLRTERPTADVIWSDHRTTAALELYASDFFGLERYYTGRFSRFNTAKRFDEQNVIDHGYLVFQDAFFRTRLSNWGDVVPLYLVDPPDEWVAVEATTANRLLIFELSDRPEQTPLFGVGEGADFGWRQLIPVVSEMADDPGPERRLVSVPEGAQVTIGDDTSRGMGARPRTATVEPGDVVRFEFSMDVTDPATSGWVDFLCVFWDGDNDRVITVAATGWRPELSTATGEFFCDVPGGLSGEVAIRGAMRLTGPIEIDIEKMTASVSDG